MNAPSHCGQPTVFRGVQQTGEPNPLYLYDCKTCRTTICGPAPKAAEVPA